MNRHRNSKPLACNGRVRDQLRIYIPQNSVVCVEHAVNDVFGQPFHVLAPSAPHPFHLLFGKEVAEE